MEKELEEKKEAFELVSHRLIKENRCLLECLMMIVLMLDDMVLDDGVEVSPATQELVEIEKRMTADLERRQHQYKRRSDEGEGERTLDQVWKLACIL